MAIERAPRSYLGKIQHKKSVVLPDGFSKHIGYEGFSDRERHVDVLNSEQMDLTTTVRVPAADGIHTRPIEIHRILTKVAINKAKIKDRRTSFFKPSPVFIYVEDPKISPTSSSSDLPITRTPLSYR